MDGYLKVVESGGEERVCKTCHKCQIGTDNVFLGIVQSECCVGVERVGIVMWW